MSEIDLVGRKIPAFDVATRLPPETKTLDVLVMLGNGVLVTDQWVQYTTGGDSGWDFRTHSLWKTGPLRPVAWAYPP